MTSPASMAAASVSMVWSVGGPAGTMTHATRGGWSCATSSWRLAAVPAPAPAASRRAASDRSNATTSWPPFSSRRVMFPPMRPRPTIPIFMRARPFLSRSDLGQVLDGHPEHPPIVALEALVVTQGLGADQGAEVVAVPGDRQGRAVPGRQQLHGHHAVGATLVELAGRVQEARPVAGGDGGPTEP